MSEEAPAINVTAPNSTIEIKCDKCVNKEATATNDTHILAEDKVQADSNNVKLAVTKCAECNQNMCTNCLLEHQINPENSAHQLIAIQQQNSLTDLNQLIQSLVFLKEINNPNHLDTFAEEIEKKRDCHQMLSSDFLCVTSGDDLPKCEESIIKRRHSNLDNSEFETKANNKNVDQCDLVSSSSSTKTVEITAQETSSCPLNPEQEEQLNFGFTSKIQSLNMQFKVQQQQQQMLKQKQQQQQQQQQDTSRLSQIECEISKTFNFYVQTLRERKDYLINELNTIVQYAHLNHQQNIQKQIQVQVQLEVKKQQIELELGEYYDLLHSPNVDLSKVNLEELNLKSKLGLLNELNGLLAVNSQLIAQLKITDPLKTIEFISNYSAIQTSIRNTFGLIRINSSANALSNNSNNNVNTQQHEMISIKRAESVASSYSKSQMSELSILCDLKPSNSNSNYNVLSSSSSMSSVSRASQQPLLSPTSINKKLKTENENDVTLVFPDQQQQILKPARSMHDIHHFMHKPPSSASSSQMQMMQQIPMNKSLQLTRSKMIYHIKFGEFGINDSQFTEPSGVTINTNNEIIVADTNSHRIQIFDRDGNFKFKFGECGKRDGQLLYPNRVSIVRQTGDIVVTERSPTHQIQIYNKYGQFLRKFGAAILQHPRGVYVDYNGRIIVVECKVMRVIIFDLNGNVLNKFNCSKYLEFPNGVCCSRPTASNGFREEIYISDNRAHCIKVFDYNGNYLRQIGGEGITNYPIGVGINGNNEILVADNHNNFNLTVFTQDGQLINALESKVKHAQCFDVGLMDDGSIVLASKDYRIYVYKYSTNMEHHVESSSPVLSCNKISSTSSLDAIGKSYDLFSDNNNNNILGFGSESSNNLTNFCFGNGDNFLLDHNADNINGGNSLSVASILNGIL